MARHVSVTVLVWVCLTGLLSNTLAEEPPPAGYTGKHPEKRMWHNRAPRAAAMKAGRHTCIMAETHGRRGVT